MGDAKVFKNYIGGEWVESVTGRTFENRNPANTDDLVGIFQKSGPEDVGRAVEAARTAWPKWKAVPAPRRGEVLFRLGQILIREKEDLSRNMTREMGKVLKETGGDTQEAIDMTFYMAGEGRRLFGQWTPSELPNKTMFSRRDPVGVCALITPWNFPSAIPSWKMMPALICGNTVVIKPATDTPWTVARMAQLVEEAGVPPGVVNLVTGSGSEVGMPLTRHPDVSLVSFTGSTDVGREVHVNCAKHHKRCCLEMGGKNPIVVMEDADLDLALEGALWGGFGTTGQRCTAASRIIVHKGVLGEFTRRLVEMTRKLRVGNGLDPEVEMGPVINGAAREKILEYVEIGRKEGARLLCGGRALTGGAYDKGFFLEPTLFGDVDPGMRIAQEEIFGPVVSLIPCGSVEEGVEIANGTKYGLSASVYTRDVNRAMWAIQEFRSGIAYVNSPTIGAETHLPFGGTKETGNGHREASVAALEVFSEWKACYIDHSGRLQKAQIDTQ